eukprot:TRINITY_DN2934_c0_g1_i1.p1 TRINITY_DN2934_c0_g1~~TRINITY_DN2934_c0_g1_i1.p1  ORF type:complete len:240 (-),score=55.13 TRINITY_DN2934_c0_g1_i1:669-1361(-)
MSQNTQFYEFLFDENHDLISKEYNDRWNHYLEQIELNNSTSDCIFIDTNFEKRLNSALDVDLAVFYAAYWYNKAVQKSINLLKRFVSLYNDSFIAWRFLGLILYNEGSFDEARHCFEMALCMMSEDSNLLVELSACLYQIGSPLSINQACQHMARCLTIDNSKDNLMCLFYLYKLGMVSNETAKRGYDVILKLLEKQFNDNSQQVSELVNSQTIDDFFPKKFVVPLVIKR